MLLAVWTARGACRPPSIVDVIVVDETDSSGEDDYAVDPGSEVEKATRHLPLVHGAPRRGHRRPARRPRLAARAVSAVGVHVSDSGAARPEPSTPPCHGSSSGVPSRVVFVATPTASSSWRRGPVVRRYHLCAALRLSLAAERPLPRARAPTALSTHIAHASEASLRNVPFRRTTASSSPTRHPMTTMFVASWCGPVDG